MYVMLLVVGYLIDSESSRLFGIDIELKSGWLVRLVCVVDIRSVGSNKVFVIKLCRNVIMEGLCEVLVF